MRTAATVKNTFKSERADAMRQLGDLLKADNERAVVKLLVNDLLDSFVRPSSVQHVTIESKDK